MGNHFDGLSALPKVQELPIIIISVGYFYNYNCLNTLAHNFFIIHVYIGLGKLCFFLCLLCF